MFTSVLLFLAYMATAGLLLIVFMATYEKFTPYREFQLIKAGNVAAATSFAGAILGFTLPLVSTIFYTHDLLEMVKWGVITGAVQLAVFAVVQRMFDIAACIREGRVASALLYASIAFSVGMLNAISISY